MEKTGVLSVRAVEILHGGRLQCPFPTDPTTSSRRIGWSGFALEVFDDVPTCTLPDHEHPTHFLNLFTSGRTRAQWRSEGRIRSADHGPDTLYLLPAGSQDRVSWLGPSNRIVLVMEPRFLARALDETMQPAGVELSAIWTFQDRHIVNLMRALAADLEDGSPVGPLYGESLGVALAHYLIRRFAVRKTHSAEPQGGMPGARLNRVKDFIQQNCAKESRLWELAQVAGMSPHYFCKLFKESVGLSPHQYVIRCRIKRAKEFLRDRRFTVNQVAEVTGFADQTHFTKVFHRLVGVTPMQFRRLA